MLRGDVAPDEAVAAVSGQGVTHRFTGLPGEDGAAGLTLALGRLRGLGFRGLALALPVPGDLAGLAGPPELSAEAIDAGEVVLALADVPARTPAVALLPQVQSGAPPRSGPPGVTWTWHSAWPPALGASLADSERELTGALRDATTLLTTLDVARGDPAAAAVLARLRSGAAAQDALPPGFPPRAYRVLTSAARVGAIVALAAASPGGAVTGPEQRARADALRPLAAASRRALCAAVNAPVEQQFRSTG